MGALSEQVGTPDLLSWENLIRYKAQTRSRCSILLRTRSWMVSTIEIHGPTGTIYYTRGDQQFSQETRQSMMLGGAYGIGH